VEVKFAYPLKYLWMFTIEEYARLLGKDEANRSEYPLVVVPFSFISISLNLKIAPTEKFIRTQFKG
jgi:hypothetical protein